LRWLWHRIYSRGRIIGSIAAPENAGAQSGEIADGIHAILRVMRQKAPGAVILVMRIVPRNEDMPFMPVIDKQPAPFRSPMASRPGFATSTTGWRKRRQAVRRHDEPDKLHPALKGYQVWPDVLKPVFTELLGGPGKEDHAPPSTGDPAARH
jgi:hypothetical protein